MSATEKTPLVTVETSDAGSLRLSARLKTVDAFHAVTALTAAGWQSDTPDGWHIWINGNWQVVARIEEGSLALTLRVGSVGDRGPVIEQKFRELVDGLQTMVRSAYPFAKGVEVLTAASERASKQRTAELNELRATNDQLRGELAVVCRRLEKLEAVVLALDETPDYVPQSAPAPRWSWRSLFPRRLREAVRRG